MAKKKKDSIESFEKTEYSEKNEEVEKYELLQAIVQVAKNKIGEMPNSSCAVKLEGDILKVIFHTYQMHLPSRKAQVDDEGRRTIDEFVKYLKKEVKSMSGQTLDLKEKKELANYTVEKVSLNERYHYICWRCYTIS